MYNRLSDFRLQYPCLHLSCKMQRREQDTCSLKELRRCVRNYELLFQVHTSTIYVTVAQRWPIDDARASCSQPKSSCLCPRLGLSWRRGSHFESGGAPGIAHRATAWSPLAKYIKYFFHFTLFKRLIGKKHNNSVKFLSGLVVVKCWRFANPLLV